MNKQLLKQTRRNLHAWLTKCKQETVHLDRRMEVVMMALADICEALTTEEPEIVDVEVVKDYPPDHPAPGDLGSIPR